MEELMLITFFVIGITVCLLMPGSPRLTTRLVLGWDALIAVYLVLGIAWLLPLRRYLMWMETGRWR